MKKGILLAAMCLLLSTGAVAVDLQVKYVGEIITKDTGIPMTIASDSQGGIYYTVINYGKENSTGCFYIADPLSLPAADTHKTVDPGTDFTVPAGRAITGVCVDSKGYVYLSYDTGAADTSSITKRSPAPSFALVSGFGADGINQIGKRFEGIEVITDDIIAVCTFDAVTFLTAGTGEELYTVGGGETYQRDMAFNPKTNDIYIAKNRDVSGYPISSANLLRGGSPDNLEGYATITNGFIPQGASGGQYGTKQQKLDYDAVNDLIIIATLSSTKALATGETFQPNIAFYSPADLSLPVITADAAESPNGKLEQTADAVAVQNKGETYIFVTDYKASKNINRIVVFKLQKGSDVTGWPVY